ncbi:NADH-quinone oxidoreductase subunit H [Thermodesulfovibrionales bacterium]|nr:NADH-quinone oxidoreductase subunit H [Thermodesulfovibrionales bacterium]MCL0049780.1 NADH-quinone oxidoreductase subunit H [Thermodesulfovibrionales bacterium]MCL0061628.1 NADH-quinone oxidoreductase subunit H [Thermodesulfovibrionales bacterium]
MILDIALAIANILYVVVMGILFGGLYRVLKARIQGRVGPPVHQYFFDIIKLFKKEDMIPSTGNRVLFDLAPSIAFSSAMLLSLLIPFGFANPFGFFGDLILILYLFTMIGVAVIIGGYASGSPFAYLGFRRTVLLTVAYKLPFVLVLISIVILTDSLSLEGIVRHQILYMPLFLPLIAGLAAFILCIQGKLFLNPFSLPDAKTDIGGGIFTEYSGRRLALFELSHLMEKFLLCILTVNLFFAFDTGLWVINTLLYLGLSLGVLVVLTVVDYCTARLTTEHLFKFYWKGVVLLATISLVAALFLR